MGGPSVSARSRKLSGTRSHDRCLTSQHGRQTADRRPKLPLQFILFLLKLFVRYLCISYSLFTAIYYSEDSVYESCYRIFVSFCWYETIGGREISQLVR